MRQERIVGILLISLLALVNVFGQSSNYTKDSADQRLRSNGRVNPSSLGLEIDIPLGAYAGRGINLPLGLSYSSKLWRFQENHTEYLENGTNNAYVFARFSESAAAGWSSSLSQPVIEYTGELNRFANNGTSLPMDVMGPGQTPVGDVYIRRITVYLPGGGSHELRADDQPHTTPTGQLPPASAWEGDFYAVDGSGLRYYQNDTDHVYRLYMPDGSYYDFNQAREDKNSLEAWVQVRRANRLTDVHGNYVQFNAPTTQYPNGTWTDQLGRTFPVMIPRETRSIPAGDTELVQTFTLPGMSAGYKLKWKKLKGSTPDESAFTDFNTQELGQYSRGTNLLFLSFQRTDACSMNKVNVESSQASEYFNPVLLTDIELPNGASYKFSYNKYGEIERIHYPAGGREEIKYEAVASLAELAAPYQQTNRGVVERNVFESDNDSSADTWTYFAASSPVNYRTSSIAPDGTQTDRLMLRGLAEPECYQQSPGQYYGKMYGFDSPLAGMPYEEREFSSSDQLIKRTLTRWTATTTGTQVTLAPARYMERNARTQSTETIVYEGNAGLSTATAFEYDTDKDALGSPLNVTKTIQYAYKPAGGGTGYTPATPIDPLPVIPTIDDPAQVATPVRMNQTVFLQSDPDYASVKDDYIDRNLVKLPTKTFVKNGSGTIVAAQSEIKYDEPGYGTALCGKPTMLRNWLDTTGTWLETKTKYDTYGNAVEVTDARQNTTTTAYDSMYHAFPVQVTSPIPSDGTHGSNVAFITTTTYNLVTGQPLTLTDANGLQTRMEYDDPLLRPTRVATFNGAGPQVGAATETYYGPGTSESTRFVKTRSQIDETNWKESYVWYDGLGRTTKSQAIDSNGDIIVDTQYDNMSRPNKVTNPHRLETPSDPAEPIYWTETTFDTAGRPWKVTTADGAVVETTYGVATIGANIGNAVTVKDQAGKLRRSITNALGHLTRVDEPTSAGLGALDAPNQPTFYTYDLLNNLTQVQQPGDNNEECGPSTTTCSQTRTFQYDSLSRLKQGTNPESGTINYGYDLNGNLLTKTDARGVRTDYVYDALNRVTNRNYSTPGGTPGTALLANYEAMPNVSYFYDNLTNAKGKLIRVTNGVGDNRSTTEYTEFDILGRVTAHKQTTDNNVYTTGYKYNLAGALIEETYPSGRVVRNTLDSKGDLLAVLGTKFTHPQFWAYANNFKYSAAGAVTRLQLGNGLWESTQFNERLQPTQIALGTAQNGTDKLKLDYQYGDLDWDSSVIAGSNNGNVAKQTITVASLGATPGFTAVQNYDYDSINRIQIASETLTPTSGMPENWVQEFRYDRYGNRRFNESTTTTLGTCPADICNPSISPNTNKITSTGYSFDNAGNTTRDAQDRKYTYSAENKQTKVESLSPGTQAVTGTIGEYFYDGDGKRIKKRAYENNVITEETIFAYDSSGKLIGEYSNQVASSQDAKVAYLTNDHLGSPRINTDINGNVTARHDYYPFGEEITTSQRTTGIGYADDTVRKQFTSQERDGETDLDYFSARYYSSRLGRFMSADPLTITPYRLVSPQALSGYAYVANNPLKFTDPTGKEIKFKNEAQANAALDAFKQGLTEEEQKAVSVVKQKDGTYSLKVDPTAGKAADSDGLLGRLYQASVAEPVAFVSIGKRDMTFSITTFDSTGKASTRTTSLKAMDDADDNVKNLVGLTLFPAEARDKAKPQGVVKDFSSEKNVTQIVVATDDTKYSATQAIYAETLAHFGEFVRTGNVSASTHASSTVETIEGDAVERAGENERANKSKSPPKTTKPQ